MVSHATHFRPADPAQAAEFDAFVGMLPILRITHPFQNVAVCGGEVIARGSFPADVEEEAREIANGRPVYIGRVEPTRNSTFSTSRAAVDSEAV